VKEDKNVFFKQESMMEEEIRRMIEEALPLVDVDAEMLFSELDSLGVTTILMLLSEHYHITLMATDATPKNFQSVATLAALVKSKQDEA
jgi:conserved domain protein